MSETLNIIGGGMAGSEAAWQAAQMGVNGDPRNASSGKNICASDR